MSSSLFRNRGGKKTMHRLPSEAEGLALGTGAEDSGAAPAGLSALSASRGGVAGSCGIGATRGDRCNRCNRCNAAKRVKRVGVKFGV